MLNKLLWFMFGVSITFGISAFTLMCVLMSNYVKQESEQIKKLIQAYFIMFVVFGLFVVFSWTFCTYWK